MEQLPNDLKNIIKDDIIFKPKTKEELQEAVDLWCENKEEALDKYGYIKNWDTSLINDMSELFKNKKKFNGNISNWDVSKVTDMKDMFWSAELFNKPLNNWNVSNVKSMARMFCKAKKFNQPLDNWDVYNVEDMDSMFFDATSFNQPLYFTKATVSSHQELISRFDSYDDLKDAVDLWCENEEEALKNYVHISNWYVSLVKDMKYLFANKKYFNDNINNWDVSNV